MTLLNLNVAVHEYDGAERMILIGGEWLHPDCAYWQARAVTPAPSKAEPEPKPISNWIYAPALTGCILGLALLPIGFVWTLPVLTVVAGFGFVLGLAWLEYLD